MSHFAVAKSMDITDAELDETVHLAASVGAAAIVAMAARARKTAERETKWWRPQEGRA